MQETGEVIKVSNNSVTVRFYRKSACGEGCASCGLCKNNENVIEAENIAEAQVGDRVIIEMSADKIFRAAFLVYILPLFTLITGYYFGGIFTKNDGIRALCGFIFMIISFFLIHLYDRKVKDKYRPQAISKLE